jgi:hypothetical protein
MFWLLRKIQPFRPSWEKLLTCFFVREESIHMERDNVVSC